jgi:hypothetical protein
MRKVRRCWPASQSLFRSRLRSESPLSTNFSTTCRFRFPVANGHCGDLDVRCFSAQRGEGPFPFFVANPRTVRLFQLRVSACRFVGPWITNAERCVRSRRPYLRHGPWQSPRPCNRIRMLSVTRSSHGPGRRQDIEPPARLTNLADPPSLCHRA